MAVGDVPTGAPWRCRLGRHTGAHDPGQGLMVYTCKRCGGSYWQKQDYSAVIAAADAMIDAGDYDGAEELKRRTLEADR